MKMLASCIDSSKITPLTAMQTAVGAGENKVSVGVSSRVVSCQNIFAAQ